MVLILSSVLIYTASHFSYHLTKTIFQVSLSINILLSLTVFFLLLAEIIPPTSLVVPLLGNEKEDNNLELHSLDRVFSSIFHDGK